MKQSIALILCIVSGITRLTAVQYQARIAQARAKLAPVKIFSEEELQESEWAVFLYNAILNKDIKDINTALGNGANPHKRFFKEDVPLWVLLFSCLKSGKYRYTAEERNAVFKNIDVTLDIKSYSNRSMTLLMYAAETNNIELADFLIKQGADLNQIDQDGMTALWYAVRNSSLGVAALLLAQPKTNVTITDGLGLTPLQWAACWVKSSAELLILLVERAQREEVDRALELAALHSNDQAIKVLISWNVPCLDIVTTQNVQLPEKQPGEILDSEGTPARLTPENTTSSTSSEHSDSLDVREWSGLESDESNHHTEELRSAYDRDFLDINSKSSSSNSKSNSPHYSDSDLLNVD